MIKELKRRGNYHHNGNPKHGLYRENKGLFNVWQSMKNRCYNPKRKNYDRYGGRGIRVCQEWHAAENFILWALNSGYETGLQLDRIDNNKDYSPDNCRWVTAKQNSQNTRRNITLTIRGLTNCVSEWSRIYNISSFTIYYWVKNKGKAYAEKRLAERTS